jgi:hypothetical protein
LVPAEYDAIRRQFVELLAAEEKAFGCSALTQSNDALAPLCLSDVMNRTWETGAFWYTMALASPSALFYIFSNHIRPLFCRDYEEEFGVVMPFFFEKNVGKIAGRKLADKDEYDRNLRHAFED